MPPTTRSYCRLKSTRIVIGFKSSTQLPGLMIIKEYYIDGEIDHAEVIYQEDTRVSDVILDSSIRVITETRLINS